MVELFVLTWNECVAPSYPT